MMLLAKVLPDQALVTWFTPKGPHEVGYHTGHPYSSSRMVSRSLGLWKEEPLADPTKAKTKAS